MREKKEQKPINILWIDDELMADLHMKVSMENLKSKGFNIFPALSNKFAKRILENNEKKIDVIIQDIMRLEDDDASFSSLAGIHFYENFLKKNYPTIPCIFHSARLDELAIVKRISTYSNCYYVPLYNSSELSIVIRSITSEKEKLFESEFIEKKHEDVHYLYTSINQELIDFLASQPKNIYKLTSRKFEELVAELLEREGFNVTLTPETRDGGIDIYAVYKLPVGSILTVVECKKYNEKNPVSVDVVRSLYGVKIAEKANKGVVITTSYFTKPAIDFTKSVGRELSLRDYNSLKNWLLSFKSNSFIA